MQVFVKHVKMDILVILLNLVMKYRCVVLGESVFVFVHVCVCLQTTVSDFLGKLESTQDRHPHHILDTHNMFESTCQDLPHSPFSCPQGVVPGHVRHHQALHDAC